MGPGGGAGVAGGGGGDAGPVGDDGGGGELGCGAAAAVHAQGDVRVRQLPRGLLLPVHPTSIQPSFHNQCFSEVKKATKHVYFGKYKINLLVTFFNRGLLQTKQPHLGKKYSGKVGCAAKYVREILEEVKSAGQASRLATASPAPLAR